MDGETVILTAGAALQVDGLVQVRGARRVDGEQWQVRPVVDRKAVHGVRRGLLRLRQDFGWERCGQRELLPQGGQAAGQLGLGGGTGEIQMVVGHGLTLSGGGGVAESAGGQEPGVGTKPTGRGVSVPIST
ncbi:hypothetical protein ACFFX0_07710 [Citricoccus parietis]|uniref:Uncharacterized protein n=1 Tax=Citricoccus parietis TaxID=592307 RepID=A0ABV5FWL5_9MICC